MEKARGEIEGGWKFQLLTNLGELPDYEKYGDDIDVPQIDAPADPDGQPVFFHRPTTYEAARNDGERWRWHLARCMELDPARRSEAQMFLADFLRSQFDVPTVASRGLPDQIVDDDHDGDLGPFAVAGLREDETLARLATGFKRFFLPDECNYIKIYRTIAESDAGAWGEQALDVLGTAFENRRQYPRAAEVWESRLHRAAYGDPEKTISAASISRRSKGTGVSSVPRASSRPARRRRSSFASATRGPSGSRPMRSSSRSCSTTPRPT